MMYRSITAHVLGIFGVALLWGTVAPAIQAQQWGDLKMQFVYDGDPPPPRGIRANVGIAPFCGALNLTDESLVIDDRTKGIQNVLVYAFTNGRGARPLPAIHPALQNNPKVHTMAHRGCQFDPRIVIMTAGDTLRVVNPDATGHNYNFNGFNNPPLNFLLAPRGAQQVKLAKPELAPVPVECNIHPWMKGYVIVSDHPYSAKSDKEGKLEIKNLPAGTTLAFRLFHERLGRSDGLRTLDGRGLPLSRNSFEVEIEPGENDMGKIMMAPEDLSH